MAKAKNVTKFLHGDANTKWLAVKARELTELNIADKVSNASAVKGKTVYLAQATDAVLYTEAQKAQGITVEIRDGKLWAKSPIHYFAKYGVTAVAKAPKVVKTTKAPAKAKSPAKAKAVTEVAESNAASGCRASLILAYSY